MSKINEALWQEAARLAQRWYAVKVYREWFKGRETLVGYNPELPGCKSTGATWDELYANLQAARTDYIYALLLRSETVPLPHHAEMATAGASVSMYWIIDFGGTA